jgi:hypothetical protein
MIPIPSQNKKPLQMAVLLSHAKKSSATEGGRA